MNCLVADHEYLAILLPTRKLRRLVPLGMKERVSQASFGSRGLTAQYELEYPTNVRLVLCAASKGSCPLDDELAVERKKLLLCSDG